MVCTKCCLPEHNHHPVRSNHAHLAPPLIPHFTLYDTCLKPHSLADFLGAPIVLQWTHVACERSCHLEEYGTPQVTRNVAEQLGAQWLHINSDWDAHYHLPAIERFRHRFDMRHPYLFDTGGLIARQLGVYMTPTVVVLDTRGIIAFHGTPFVDHTLEPSYNAPVGPVRRCLEELSRGETVTTPELPQRGRTIQVDPPEEARRHAPQL
ncbi:MAG: peroxiredoxin family protein [Phycisphaerales bacterium JB043]